ncbi:MAG: hypothetical protein AABX85_00595 [Nanoarchaeota archaeon]
MASQTGIREYFLMGFVRELVKSMINSGKVKGKMNYPDIERIKKNIKIYERPGSTFANAILMNQSPEILNAMQPFESVKEVSSQIPNIASIMEEEKDEHILPLPLKIPSPSALKVEMKIKKNVEPMMLKIPSIPPVSQLMPFAYQRAGMRLLPSMNKPTTVQLRSIEISPTPLIPEKITVLDLPKIDKFLQDPGVQTVECPGPNKKILVFKGGRILSTDLNLTADEINNVMKDISEKTRIPLMSGVFKAAYGNLIITSVMSEFVGTRFIIQKKLQMPPQQQSSIYK